MRPALMRLTVIGIYLICFSGFLTAQNCFNTGLNGMVINLSCSQNCLTTPLRIPHLKSTSDYSINTIAYTPYPYTTATGNEAPATVYADDFYSPKIDLPFAFCFYDSVFYKVVYGSNGLITFDTANANCSNSWPITTTIPFNGGTICTSGSTYYPKASIMAAYSDLDPRTPLASPADRKIEWRVEGSAPCRRLIVSYYHIGVFSNPGCGLNTPNTFQIVLYESTGLIEIFIEQKACTSSTNAGRAILGIQNWTRDKAVPAPGKNNIVWNETNTAYRFTPSGGASRFESCVVQNLSGTILATGDTVTTTPGLLDVTFPTFCPAGVSGQYVIKTIYSSCDIPGNQIISYDTITINKTNNLNATPTVTQTNCGVTGSGTLTVTVPPGVGTAPYTFVLSPGGTTLTGNSPQTFTGLAAGNYSVVVTDAGTCNSNVPAVITSTGVLAVTYSVTNTTCVGAANGNITVNPPNGTPPITYSINGGPFLTNNVFSNLAPGTYFISTHDNAGCVRDFDAVTVIAGAAITMTTSSTPTSCVGANNGSISVTGSTGTAPFQYSINGGAYQASNTFTNLAPATYFISLVDAIGCTISFTPVTVAQGTGTVTGTATSTPPSCSGATNGTITVTPSSGSGPYQYSLNGGPYQASNTFTGLAPGNYTVTIREAGLCTSTPIPVTVNAGTPLLATTATTATSCNGAADGTITVAPTNGAAPYQYSLDGGPNQASNIFNGVAAGSHNIIVRDVAGCISAQIPVTIAAGPALTGTATSTTTACVGVNNGTITATSTNGTGPYQYSLDAGAPQASNVFTGVSAGAHNITIRNALGCVSGNIPVTVAAGTTLTATTTTIPTACPGISNGSITVMPTNGSAPYQYSLNGAAPQTSNVFNGVAAGSHNIIVTDNFGCISAPIATTVSAGTILTGTATSIATTCNGASNGSITATATNGGAPYQYALDGGAYQVNNIFNAVISGAHNVVITDNFGCVSAPIVINVAAGGPLNATAASISTSCNGAINGSINVTPATNGTAPYQYSLNGGTPQAIPNFTGLSSGTHTINVTDAGGCSSGGINVTVNAGPPINLTLNKIDANCFGSATGIITATPSANTIAPLQYSLDNVTWQASPNFNGLAAATYTVYIRDAVGCSNSGSITIGQPNQLTASATTQNVLCNGASNGVININATGGTGAYSYSLDNLTYQPGSTFNVLAGNYTVYVRDANGCAIAPITNVNVTEPALLTATSLTNNATCNGGLDGTININAAGGTSPYQYSITGTTYQAGNSFNVAPGTYTVTVKDANGCTYPVAGVVVGLTNNLTLTPAVDPAPICEGNSVQLQVNTNATEFVWTPALKLSGTTIANPVASPPTTTLYTVTATLGRCSVTDDVLVTVISAPIPNAGPDGDICYGQSYQLQGSGGATYTWTPSSYLSTSTISNPQVTPDKMITYTLNVTDANGCPSLTIDQVTVNVTPPIKVTVFPSDTVVYARAQIPLLATSAGTSYTWTPVSGLDNPNIANPIATAPLIEGSVVIYQVIASTSAGCQGQAYVTVKVYKGPDIYVPTAFTPNNDGKNDVFMPYPVGIKQLNYFRVFNRWGQVVYSTTVLNNGWDGRLSGIEQPAGVYVWMVQGTTMDNKVISKQGTVTLIH